MDICVVALGKIGLPLAVQFATKGHRVLGADIDAVAVDSINAGQPPFPGEEDLDRLLRDVIDRELLTATTDTAAAVAQAEVVVVVVPLIVDTNARPEFRALDAATEAIGNGLQPDTLVCYETTLPVGTTRDRFTPALAAVSGLRPGDDLFVCFSPERVYSGRIFRDLRRYPKLVGGIDEMSTQRALAFYEQVLDFDERPDLDRPNGVWDLGSAEAAEFTKLAETTYRDVNIGLANEFALFADRIGVDVVDVIAAANSQPFSHIHLPGIAVGGHCIPVYPRFYLSNDPGATLPAAARAVNEQMPEHAVQALVGLTGDLNGKIVAVLGAAYRGDVKEAAFSGVHGVVAALRARGAAALVHDPLFSDDELAAMGFAPYEIGAPVDAVVVQTDHRSYRDLGPRDLPGAEAVVDGRRVLDRARFVEANVAFAAIGDGSARAPSR